MNYHRKIIHFGLFWLIYIIKQPEYCPPPHPHPDLVPLTQCIQDPVVLLVSVVILGGPESVSHVLHTVHYRAGKVIGGVHSEKLQQQIKHI